MSEREQKRSGAGCFICGVVLILLPVLYVLGIGPAAWMSEAYPATEQRWGLAYAPVLIICEHIQPVGDIVDWYMELWTG